VRVANKQSQGWDSTKTKKKRSGFLDEPQTTTGPNTKKNKGTNYEKKHYLLPLEGWQALSIKRKKGFKPKKKKNCPKEM